MNRPKKLNNKGTRIILLVCVSECGLVQIFCSVEILEDLVLPCYSKSLMTGFLQTEGWIFGTVGDGLTHLSHITRCSGFNKRSADLVHVKGIKKTESFFFVVSSFKWCHPLLSFMPRSQKRQKKHWAIEVLKTKGLKIQQRKVSLSVQK